MPQKPLSGGETRFWEATWLGQTRLEGRLGVETDLVVEERLG